MKKLFKTNINPHFSSIIGIHIIFSDIDLTQWIFFLYFGMLRECIDIDFYVSITTAYFGRNKFQKIALA